MHCTVRRNTRTRIESMRLVLLLSSFILGCVALFRLPKDRHASRVIKVDHRTDGLYGPFIVHLDQLSTSHDHFASQVQAFEQSNHPFNKFQSKITHKYQHVLFGVTIEGITREVLLGLPGVVRVVRNTKKSIAAYSWGTDRLDQLDLPLDNAYSPAFTGLGVDVYIVDTGLDTTHVEFAGNPLREVKNVYDAYASTTTANNDGQGHGTHVAGTIGGNTVGVSRNANLYGAKVLSDEGSGETSDIVGALDFVMSRALRTRRPSIVSMSLGGPCEGLCSEDSLVIATERLVANGVVVSVAAGNEGCNACSGSPNSAPNAINGAYRDRIYLLRDCINVIFMTCFDL